MRNTFEIDTSVAEENNRRIGHDGKEIKIDPTILADQPGKNDSREMNKDKLEEIVAETENVGNANNSEQEEIGVNIEEVEAERSQRLQEVREGLGLNNENYLGTEGLDAVLRFDGEGLTINNTIVNKVEGGDGDGRSSHEMSASSEYEDCSVCGGTGRVPLFFSFLKIWPCSRCGATGRVIKSESYSHKSSE